MPFPKYSIEKDELVNLFQKLRHLLILWKGDIYTNVLNMWHSLFQLYVGGYDLVLAGCDLFYLGLGGCGWVLPFYWLGGGGCGWVWPFFLAGYEWVWPFLTGCGWVWVSVGGYGWVWMGMGECGWVWVSARFITTH